jgi:hypothetical protein
MFLLHKEETICRFSRSFIRLMTDCGHLMPRIILRLEMVYVFFLKLESTWFQLLIYLDFVARGRWHFRRNLLQMSTMLVLLHRLKCINPLHVWSIALQTSIRQAVRHQVTFQHQVTTFLPTVWKGEDFITVPEVKVNIPV